MARGGNRDAHPDEFSRGVAQFTGTFFLTLVAAGADVVETASHGELGGYVLFGPPRPSEREAAHGKHP